MSGSLQFRGDLGKCVATTANNSLTISQSAFSYSLWVEVISFAGTGNNVIFGTTSGQTFLVQFNGFSQIAVFLHGANSVQQFGIPIKFGLSIHIAGTLNATGVSKIYVNGVIQSTASNIGITSATPTGIMVGWGSAVSSNFLISDAAIWAGTELPSSDIINLRDRTATPATTSTPASSWWTLQGTTGSHPVASAAGLADQIGSNHFTTLPGSGGSTTNAVYSSTDLVYVSPITIAEAVVCRSGDVVKISMGTNPILGPVVPAFITAINANPTISVNGVPVTGSNLQGPFYASSTHSIPWVIYQIVGGVQPTDVVTYSAPDSWVSSSIESAGPESGTFGNYAGAYEPGVFGYTGFDPPDSWKKLGLGFNIPDGESAAKAVGVLKNSAHKVSLAWSHASVMSPTVLGLPLNIDSFLTASTTVWQSNTFNGVSATSGFPFPTGTWVVIADETNPSSPMVVGLTGANVNILFTGPTITPGTIDSGGVERNKQWAWDIEYSNPASSAVWTAVITLSLTTPDQINGNQTLVNLRLFEPGNIPTFGNVDNVINDNFAAMLTASPGVHPAVIRSMEGLAGSDGCSALLNANDYPPNSDRLTYNPPAIRAISDWTANEPTFTGNRIIPIYETRPYDPGGASSQYVYVAQNYLRTTVSLNPAFAYQWDLTALGLEYDWPYPNLNTNNGKSAVIEYVVADALGNPIKHNLQSGQLVATGGMNTINVANSLTTGTASPNANIIAWVTSEYTFIGVVGTTLPSGATRLGFATGTTLTTWGTATCTVSPTVIQYAVEDYGVFAKALPGTGIWFAVNHCATDAAVTSLATRMFNATLRGTPIFIEFSNEILIPNFQFAWVNQIASLQGLSYPQVDIQRTSEVHKIFENIWGADSGSLVRIFQPFSGDTNSALTVLQYAQLHSIKIDALALASYVDMDTSPPFKMAAAAICVNENITYPANPAGGIPGLVPTRVSIAYTAGPGGTPLPAMPMAAFADMYRHYIKYNKVFNGPTGQNPKMYSTLLASGYGQGGGSGFVYKQPIFIGYECNVSAAIPAGPSTLTRIVRAGLTHDVMYHPSFYDITNAFLQHLQEPGPAGIGGGYTFACIEALTSPRGFALSLAHTDDGYTDQLSAEAWGDFIWPGQQPGHGLSNSYWAQDLGGDGNTHEYNNESVNARAHFDWINATAGLITVSFTVSPNRVPKNHAAPITLTLAGTATTWTSGSTVSIINSVSGTTSVTVGTWTQVSATSATLTVTTGAGDTNGTWILVIDGVNSGFLAFGFNVETRLRWAPGRLRQARRA